jgi:hypothetical protein
MGYLPSLSSKAAHFVSDLTTVILNPVSERETSHLPVRHRIPAPFPSPPLSCRRFGPVLNLGSRSRSRFGRLGDSGCGIRLGKEWFRSWGVLSLGFGVRFLGGLVLIVAN